MAFPALQKAFGGVIPGGAITIASGTPVAVTVNLALINTRGNLMCRQIGISVDSGAGGAVFVNYGNFPGLGDQTALIVQAGQTQALPVNSRTVEGEIDATKWYLDCAAGSATVVISFADASNW